jgi:predicted DNA-binding protein (MmcQ/YjbR family)
MLTQAQFAAMALGFPGAARAGHFDVTDFRVRGKIFATLREKDGRAVLKLAPDQQALLLETSGGQFAPVAGSWGLKGWTQVMLGEADEEAVRHAMAMAWRSVAPKSLL